MISEQAQRLALSYLVDLSTVQVQLFTDLMGLIHRLLPVVQLFIQVTFLLTEQLLENNSIFTGTTFIYPRQQLPNMDTAALQTAKAF